MSKVFKNNQHLDFEEMLVYIQSRLGMKEVEIGCFLCNFEDGTACKEKVCKNYFNCTMMQRELDRLDNVSTATEIEKLLQPVYLYRQELQQKDPVDKLKEEKVDYSTTCNLDDEDLSNRCWQCSRFCFPIGCMVGEDGEDK